jgi:integrase/recombinase XerD
MKVSKAVNLFLDYHKMNSQKNTIRAYSSLLAKFRDYFPDHHLAFISPEEVLSFLTSLNDTCKQLTKHTRYAYLKALFNFIRNNLDAQLQNPRDTPMLKKLFRLGKLVHWQVQEKETIDEVIFRTTKVRNRLMLELMARGGRRVGEVLKLTGGDVEDQKLARSLPYHRTSENCINDIIILHRHLWGGRVLVPVLGER